MKRVIYFEGFLGQFHHHLRNTLIAKIQKEFPTVLIEERLNSDRRPIDDMEAVVIGHGFGAYVAWLVTERCKTLITLDLHQAFGNSDEQYVHKLQFGRNFNFYQRGLFKGYRVLRANNQLIHNETHTTLTTATHVWRVVKSRVHNLR